MCKIKSFSSQFVISKFSIDIEHFKSIRVNSVAVVNRIKLKCPLDIGMQLCTCNGQWTYAAIDIVNRIKIVN